MFKPRASWPFIGMFMIANFRGRQMSAQQVRPNAGLIHACRTATENKLTEPNQSPDESHRDQGSPLSEEETMQIPTSDAAPAPSGAGANPYPQPQQAYPGQYPPSGEASPQYGAPRSEEHTSELQSRGHL